MIRLFVTEEFDRGNSGRRRTGRSEENIAAVRELLEENPHVSSRRNPVAVTQSTLNRIVNKIRVVLASLPHARKTRIIKAAFHFRVLHTHVYPRKTLNPSTLYIF